MSQHRISLLIVLLLCLQWVVIPRWLHCAIAVDLVLILVLYRSIYLGCRRAMWWGFGIGIIEDVLNVSIFGLYAGLRVIAAYLPELFRHRFNLESRLVQVMLLLLLYLIQELIRTLIFLGFGRQVSWSEARATELGLGLVITLILFFPIAYLLDHYREKVET